MSFIKIERIDPNIINNPDAGHIYLGQDSIGLWEKDEYGNITYILSGNTYITINNFTGITYNVTGSTSSGTSGISSNGTAGTSGKSGISGTFGTSGSSGNGTSGSSGDGTSGSSGVSNDGTSGTSAINGTSGTSSSSGESGSSGSSGEGLDGTSGSSGIDGGYGGATRRWLLNLSSTTPSAGEMCISLVGGSLDQFNYLRLHRIDADSDMMDGWLSTWTVGILKIEDRRNLSIVGVYYIHTGSTITKIGGTFYQISDITVLSASGVVSDGEFLISFVHSDSGTSGSSGNSYNVNGTQNYIPKFGTNGTSIINTTTPIFELNNKIGIGTLTPNEQLELTGNFRIPLTTSTSGIIYMSDYTYIHSYSDITNMFMGINSGNLNLTGRYNVGLGTYTLANLTTGNRNVGLGYSALSGNTTGHNNTAVGWGALNGNVLSGQTGLNNVAIGFISLVNNSTGSYNLAIGSETLENNTTGSYNIAIGSGSLLWNLVSNVNIGIGFNALNSLTSGNTNISIGSYSLDALINGDNNISFGTNCFRNIVTAFDNIVIGNNTMNVLSYAGNNVFIGNNLYYSGSIINKFLVDNNSGSTPLIYGEFDTHRIGLGTTGYSDATLHVVGDFKYVDGNQGNGKMLVSDANGMAHWMSGTTIPNFYCSTWQEVKNAVLSINSTYEGGNIYLDGYIRMTESISWNLTNINFYGFSAYWCFATGETMATATGYSITITDGNPTFTDVNFNYIWHNAYTLQLQLETNKTLFNLTGGDAKIKFENCGFFNFVGGTTGITNNIQISSINNYTTVSLKFNNCFVTSSNNNIPFLSNGFKIGTTTLNTGSNAKLLIIATNHQLNNSPTDSGNTASCFIITGSTAPNSLSRGYTTFTSDESAWVKETNYIGIRTNIIQNVAEKSSVNSEDYMLLSSSSGTDSFNNIKKIKASNFLSMSDFDQNLQIPIGKAILHRNVMGIDSVGDWREWSDSSGFYIDYCSSLSPTVWTNKHTVTI